MLIVVFLWMFCIPGNPNYVKKTGSIWGVLNQVLDPSLRSVIKAWLGIDSPLCVEAGRDWTFFFLALTFTSFGTTFSRWQRRDGFCCRSRSSVSIRD